MADGVDRNVARERTALGKAGLMAALVLAPALAGAQPASDYQLPPASPSPAPRAAGPVEEGAPAPTVAASPAAAPTAKIVIPNPPAATPSPRPRATQAAPVPARRAAARPTPAATPAPESTMAPTPPVASAAAPEAAPLPATVPTDASLPRATAESTPDTAPSIALWTGIAAVTVALVAAVLFWRRRRPVVVAPAIVVPAPTSEPTPAPPAEPVASPAPAPTPAPIPATTLSPRVVDPLVLMLEATRMSATLVNTTLAYRLVVVNRGTEPLTDIAIGGDMTAAHASKPMDEQLGLAGPELPAIHRIDRLDPGAELALPGEMRLPLTAVTPIRAGEAALFVPLARFDAWASTPDGGAIHARAAYMVGQESTPTADRLQPFRLDLGPRTWADLGQRALALPVS